MVIKKRVAFSLIIYIFLVYLAVAIIKPALPFPNWTLGLYGVVVLGVCIWACVEENWKIKGLATLGVIGFVGLSFILFSFLGVIGGIIGVVGIGIILQRKWG